jgi:hypothetical protein
MKIASLLGYAALLIFGGASGGDYRYARRRYGYDDYEGDGDRYGGYYSRRRPRRNGNARVSARLDNTKRATADLP